MYDVIVICGPTASGKTSLAIDIAKYLNTQIVSADSMQIYKEMNIGTAKPSESEREGIVHYMFDVISVTDKYSVARYVKDAERCIDKINSSGKTAILTGGTGLYIDSLINNTNFIETKNDPEYREKMLKSALEKGNEHIYGILKDIDPNTASMLHLNDTKRIVRALEVYHLTGKTMTQARIESIRDRKYNTLFIGLNFKDRQKLYDRINKRVDIMLDHGLVNEAKKLYKFELSDTARHAIGYSELFDYFDGNISFENAVETIKRKSRNYAKRQITWFNRNNEINWFYLDDYENYDVMQKNVKKLINK